MSAFLFLPAVYAKIFHLCFLACENRVLLILEETKINNSIVNANRRFPFFPAADPRNSPSSAFPTSFRGTIFAVINL